jgi:hypothetical protein
MVRGKNAYNIAGFASNADPAVFKSCPIRSPGCLNTGMPWRHRQEGVDGLCILRTKQRGFYILWRLTPYYLQKKGL